MNQLPGKRIINRLPIVRRKRVDRTINARTGSMQERASGDQIMINGIKRTAEKDIIPRRGEGRVPMKGGGDVRLIGDGQTHDSKDKTGGGAERKLVNKKRRQRRKFKARRWQDKRNRRGACRRTKKGDKASMSIVQGRGRTRNLQQKEGSQENLRRKGIMAEGRSMGAGRWTRSKAEGGIQK